MRTIRSRSRGRDDVDVADHPAPALQGNLAVDLLIKVEDAEPCGTADRRSPGCCSRAMQQHVLELLARQAGVGIETRPSRCRARPRPLTLSEGLRPIMTKQPAHLEPVVAEPGLAEPSAPAFNQRAERRVACGFPLRADRKRCAHRQRASLMDLLVGIEQFGRDAVALVDAGGAETVVGARRLGQRAHAVGVREPCRIAEPDQLGDRLEFALDEHPGRVAVAVLLDGQRVDRRDRIARDAGAPRAPRYWRRRRAGMSRARSPRSSGYRPDCPALRRRAPAASASASRQGCPAHRSRRADRRSAWSRSIRRAVWCARGRQSDPGCRGLSGHAPATGRRPSEPPGPYAHGRR